MKEKALLGISEWGNSPILCYFVKFQFEAVQWPESKGNSDTARNSFPGWKGSLSPHAQRYPKPANKMAFIASIFIILVPYPSVPHLHFLNLIRPALILTSVCSVASSALEKNTSSSKFTKNTYCFWNIGKKMQKSVSGLVGKKNQNKTNPKTHI